MPITIHEMFESRLITTGRDPSVELRYSVHGTNESDEARAAVEAAAPIVYDIYDDSTVVLPRHTVTIEPVGDGLWEGVAQYGTVPQTNESTFAFDTGGGMQHVTQSHQTEGRYAPPGQIAPDFRGAIGVTADNVAGVDVAVPVYHFSETHYLPDETIAAGYSGVLFQLTGKVNDASFRGFAAGECLFLGASGAKRGYGDWEITYRFAASPNATGLIVGDIINIAKRGFEYLWVRYADVEDTEAKTLVKRPLAAYVERVYEEGNFGLLGDLIMAAVLKKARPGEPLVIPATTYNAFVDAARAHRDRQQSATQNAERELPSTTVVLVRNESGTDRGRFDVLGVAAPVITPSDNTSEFAGRIALRGVVPASEHAGRFVVLLEPITIGAIGRACAAGVCPVRVTMADENHGYADVSAGETHALLSGESGSAVLLWVEPLEQRDDPAIAWTLSRIGGGSSGGGSASAATLGFCQIESSIGTSPPYVYTARRVTPEAAGGFSAPEGDDFDLLNLAEIGAGGAGVHEVPDGAVVAFWQDPATGEYFFDRSFYRGTY